MTPTPLPPTQDDLDTARLKAALTRSKITPAQLRQIATAQSPMSLFSINWQCKAVNAMRDAADLIESLQNAARNSTP